MLRVGFVLRSTEIQPVCFRFVSPAVVVVFVAQDVRGSEGFGRGPPARSHPLRLLRAPRSGGA